MIEERAEETEVATLLFRALVTQEGEKHIACHRAVCKLMRFHSATYNNLQHFYGFRPATLVRVHRLLTTTSTAHPSKSRWQTRTAGPAGDLTRGHQVDPPRASTLRTTHTVVWRQAQSFMRRDTRQAG